MSTAVVGLSNVVSPCSTVESVGRLSVDLNFEVSVLPDTENFPRDLGSGGSCDGGVVMLSGSSSSTGDVVNGVAMIFPDEGNLGL